MLSSPVEQGRCVASIYNHHILWVAAKKKFQSFKIIGPKIEILKINLGSEYSTVLNLEVINLSNKCQQGNQTNQFHRMKILVSAYVWNAEQASSAHLLHFLGTQNSSATHISQGDESVKAISQRGSLRQQSLKTDFCNTWNFVI